MPKVTRRKSKPKSSPGVVVAYWKKVTIVALPALLFLFIVNQSNGSVLGISDFVNKKATVSTSPKNNSNCKPTKINSITFSSPCNEKLGFQKVTYSCADGASSSISSTTCGNPQQLFEKVMKACNKNSKCKPQMQKQNGNQQGQSEKGNMQRGNQQGNSEESETE